MTEEDRISHLVDLTQKIFLVVERELKLTGFWESIPARNKLKADLQKILLADRNLLNFPISLKTAPISFPGLWRLRKINNDTILYAE